MFILRTIDTEGIVENQLLGTAYTFVCRFQSPEIFREQFEKHFDKQHVADLDDESDFNTKNVVGFIIGKEVIGDNFIPIYQTNQHYVMTDTGKTFSKL